MSTGGSAATIVKDIDQAHKMVNMRIKIDVWSKGLEESEREDIHEKLRDLFCQLQARRLWFYLKQLRPILLRERPESLADLNDDIQAYMDGPEDVIVKGNTIPVLP